MKLIVLIGTDCHLELLPHFLEHYSRIGVNLFLCGLHGERRDEAQALLARYRFEVVVDFGTKPYAEELTKQWVQISNQVRRQHAEPGEWCLYADVDEFHEYPPDFFASLDQPINAVRGWWVERLATSDGQLLPCLPDRNVGQQFPFATQNIFCGLSEKVMAVRADLDLSDGYHWVVGGGDSPMFHQDYLRVHHFRWDNHAKAKYASINWTRHYKFKDERVPYLRGVFYVNPPFPPVGSGNGGPHTKVSVILLVQDAASQVGLAIRSIRAQTLSEWELIVVDTGASDQAKATVHFHANGDERIRVVAASGPLREARRIGFVSARGGYIYCLDANHCSLPDTLQRLCHCLDTQLEAPVAGVLHSLTPESNPLHAFKRLGAEGFLNTGAVAIRRSALNAALADPECDFEDQWLWWSLLREGPAAFVEGKALTISNPLSSACSVMASASGAPEMKQTPVKLAYLIVAHYQPAHLGRLIRALDQEDSHFFIHIDAKADLPSFQAVVPPLDNIIFVEDRVTVEWGRFSVVQATLNLIQAAFASGHSFKYFTLLSGSDYPVKHKQAIGKRLANSNRQYIRIDRRLTQDPGNGHGRLLRDLPGGAYFREMVPYHGSMYWSLTADCMRFILDFINRNPAYVDVHRHVLIPDEVFFHTLVRHSPFASAITHDFAAGPCPDHTHHGNHFIDWANLRQRDNLTLDERDFDDLLASDALFARKFVEHESSKLLELLDIYVHGSSPKTDRV